MLLFTASYAQNSINENRIWEHYLKLALHGNGPIGDPNRDIGPNGITFPFTKWCGPGSTARHFDDLGEDRDTDICCREHDHCDQGINTGHELCDYKNNGFKM